MNGMLESNSFRAGLIGAVLVIAGVLSAQNYDHVPYLAAHREYEAYFAEAAGLRAGAPVEVAGVTVGQVTNLDLRGNKILVRFTANGVRLGDQTEAAIKTKTVLGSKMMELRPRGTAALRPDSAIGLEHTSTPYVLPDTLGDLTTSISGLKTDQITQALHVLSSSVDAVQPDLAGALDGVARLSESVDSRDRMLTELLSHASGVTQVLAKRSDQLNRLVVDGNTLLAGLDARGAAIATLLDNVNQVSQQLRQLVADNREQLGPVLDRFNNVLDLLDRRRSEIQQSLLPLSQYALSLGESVASGPFFKAYIVNLLPGQFLQPFIDAAFKDAGVDPSILGGPTYKIDGGYNNPPGTVPPEDTAPGPNTPVPAAPPPPFPTFPPVPTLPIPGAR
ncbi:MCE family protein [Nocardia sp. NPDC052278]|uniref:MCE family protein n=1 Tax=unclassified Nocardia TaxID=2637762 RepID=UPI003687533A